MKDKQNDQEEARKMTQEMNGQDRHCNATQLHLTSVSSTTPSIILF